MKTCQSAGRECCDGDLRSNSISGHDDQAHGVSERTCFFDLGGLGRYLGLVLFVDTAHFAGHDKSARRVDRGVSPIITISTSTACVAHARQPDPGRLDVNDFPDAVNTEFLSGNRNFPGRIHPDLDLAFLASPPLVVAFALAGDADRDSLAQGDGYPAAPIAEGKDSACSRALIDDYR